MSESNSETLVISPNEVQAQVFAQTDLDEPSWLPFAGGALAVFTRRCPGATTPNEDSAAVIFAGPASGVLVVADGVGGERSGHRASTLAVQTICDAVADAPADGDDLRPFILDGIERANQAILGLGIGAATTLSVVEVKGSLIRPYHIGDSVILLTGQRGKVKLQTIPHSPIGAAVEAGVIDETAAFTHEDRHVVSNVVGAHDMRIEMGSPIRMSPRDTLVLASDGLSDNLTDLEIIELIRKGPLADRARRLVADATNRMNFDEAPTNAAVQGKPDDLTFILFRRTV